MRETSLGRMSAIAAGDEAAFAALYDEFAPRLLGLIVRVLGTRQDSEDVLQEVFREVWCNADRYDGRLGSEEVWLFMLTRSRAIDSVRRRRSQDAAQAAVERPIPAGPDAEADVELEQRTNRALALLPREQGEPIFLSFYRGLSGRQIAELIGVPVGTVKTRIRLGMQKLRTHLTVQDQTP
jgi:RNA polymerase sigma-70 factor (ECF subfamily)